MEKEEEKKNVVLNDEELKEVAVCAISFSVAMFTSKVYWNLLNLLHGNTKMFFCRVRKVIRMVKMHKI